MNTVLLASFQKSGSSWCRFIIGNYYNILNGAEKTLTWDELQEPHVLRKLMGLNYTYNDIFPPVFHTHDAYDGQGLYVKHEGYPEYFEQFDKIVYIYRNPHDTMISLWHWLMNREDTNYELDLADFTREYLPKWIHHVKTTRDKADLVLDYDILRQYPNFFYDVIKLIQGFVNEKIMRKAIEMSTFTNIRRMSIETNQPYGLGGVNYRGFFCRNGQSKQYRDVMSYSLIKWVKKECKKEGIIP